MVKDKEELLLESQKWSDLAILEVKNLDEALMTDNDLSIEELADRLGWKPKKVEACLNGEGDLRIRDIATLLIANDIVVEIKPAECSPISYGCEVDDNEDEDKRDWDDEDEDCNDEDIQSNTNNVDEKNMDLRDFLLKIIDTFQK